MIVPTGHDQLVGCEVPERPPSKHGLRILRYCDQREAYLVVPIRWRDGSDLGEGEIWIDQCKIGYRYDLRIARQTAKGAP